ncbi:MAG: hypothetical protein LUE19_08575 [Clostridiales bacterium]|nr:hypothetical protein [Clostridiales bacterium]
MDNSMECEPEEEERTGERLSEPGEPAEYIPNYIPMPLMNSAYEPGRCLETAQAMGGI